MKYLFAFSVYLLLFISSSNCSKAQNRHFDSVTLDNGTQIPYSFHLPDNYDPQKSYPILIAPGDGTPGSDFSFFWRGANTAKYGWILVESPAVFQEDRGKKTEALLSALESNFSAEGGKFHAIGWSANSGSVFRKVMSMPDRFHSITGIPGHPSNRQESELIKLKNIRVHFIVGANDGYWLNQAKSTEAALKELEVNVLLDIIPKGGHVLKELRGDGLMEKMERMRSN